MDILTQLNLLGRAPAFLRALDPTIIDVTNTNALDDEIRAAIRAVNRQIAEYFETYWSLGAERPLEGLTGSKPSKASLARRTQQSARG